MINFLLSFRLATLLGIGLAYYLNSISTEKQPVWQFVTWPYLYIILFLDDTVVSLVFKYSG